MVKTNQMQRYRDRVTQSISCICGTQPGFCIYHHCNSTQAADKKVPLIHSFLAPIPSLLPDPLHGLLATLLQGLPFHSRPFYT